MAYSELVSYIKEQLKEGRDPRSIRSYLLSQRINPKSIDMAFDEAFSKAPKHGSPSVEKYLIVGVAVLLLVIAGSATMIYYNNIIPSEIPVFDEQPIINTPVLEEFGEEMVCDLEDSEEKYACYTSLFETNAIDCFEIENFEEQDFCYRAQDWYALSV